MRKQHAKESALQKNNFTIYEKVEKRKKKGKRKRLFRKEQNEQQYDL